MDALDMVCSSNRKASTSASNLVLVLFLLKLQVRGVNTHLIFMYVPQSTILLFLGVPKIIWMLVHQPGQQVNHEYHSLHRRVCSLLLCCYWICLWISRICQRILFVFIVTFFNISWFLGSECDIPCSLVLRVGSSQDICQSENSESQHPFYSLWVIIWICLLSPLPLWSHHLHLLHVHPWSFSSNGSLR